MANAGSSFIEVPKRPLTAQEELWVREIVSANPKWADINLDLLHVIGECTCGCRSVVFQEPAEPQKPDLAAHQRLVGELSLSVKVGDKKDPVSVLLHFAGGSLSLLEVVWYNFPDPVPSEWVEISKEVIAGDVVSYLAIPHPPQHLREGRPLAIHQDADAVDL